MMEMPDAGPMVAWVCGPIRCGLDEACVYRPASRASDVFGDGSLRTVPPTYDCRPDMGCGIDGIIQCAEELDACLETIEDRNDREEGMEGVRECNNDRDVRLANNYLCQGTQLASCTEEISYELIESFEENSAGVPLDPRDVAAATPGVYVAPFVICP